MTRILNPLEVMDGRLVDKNLVVPTLNDCANVPNGQIVFVSETGKFYTSNQTATPLQVYPLATSSNDGLMSKEDKEAFNRLSLDISDHSHNIANSQTAGFVKLDSTITANSQSAVTSGAIYSALAEKSDINHTHEGLINLDSTITAGGQNPVSSGVIHTALNAKADLNHDHAINANGTRYNTLADALNSRSQLNHTHQEVISLSNVVSGSFDTINHSYTGALTNLLAGRLSVAALDGRYALKSSTGGVAGSASDITFTPNGQSAMTVQQALEILMFEPLTLTNFSISPNTTTYEVGQSTGEILVTWSTQGTPQITGISLTVNNEPISNISTSATSATIPSISSNTDSATTKAIRLTISTTTKGGDSTSIASTKNISFLRKIFFGNSEIVPSDISQLSNSQFESNKIIEFASIGTGICFIAPASLSIKSAIAGTFESFSQSEFITSNAFTISRNGVNVSYRSYLLKPAVGMDTSLKITLQ